MFKKMLTLVAATVLSSSAVFGGELTNVSGASGIALNGYDPVAFFTDAKPVHGDPGISAKYKGATYLFASKEHRALFEKSPEKYAPQYGGFCAYGVSVNALFPVDINTWQVRDGKLYLNLNPEILTAFNTDFQGNIEKADANWKALVAKHGSSAR